MRERVDIYVKRVYNKNMKYDKGTLEREYKLLTIEDMAFVHGCTKQNISQIMQGLEIPTDKHRKHKLHRRHE